jgi:hypothetical protein
MVTQFESKKPAVVVHPLELVQQLKLFPSLFQFLLRE